MVNWYCTFVRAQLRGQQDTNDKTLDVLLEIKRLEMRNRMKTCLQEVEERKQIVVQLI